METTYCMFVFVFICNSINAGFGQPAYDYDCLETFNQREGIIKVLLNVSSPCQWNFTTHSGEHFRLTFTDFSRASGTECETHHVEVQNGPIRQVHCGNQTTPYSVSTSSSVQIKRHEGIGFTAKISIVSGNTFTVNDTGMTWLEAFTACKELGATLAEVYPVVTQEMNDIFKNHSQHDQTNLASQYWVGMSVTPWITLRGCVQWTKRRQLRQIELKNNGKTECAVRCSGYAGFLLSERLCHCHNEIDDIEFNFTYNERCDHRCHGNQKERCGGNRVYTLYDYSRGMVLHGTESKHCIVKVDDGFIAEDCDSPHGFTCSLTDGSNVTFNPTLPGIQQLDRKTQWEAIEFCTRYNNSLYMASQPEFPHPYFNESYWTTISRGVVWNPMQGIQDTKFSFVASIDKVKKTVVTSITDSKEKHGFICQHEKITCGSEVSGDVGKITSVNYPRHYKNYQTCEWRLTVNETKTIQIDIPQLDLEYSVDCVYDYLQIIEKNGQPIKLCGSYSQKQILTQGNEVTLKMKTDDSVTLGGFALTWTTVKHDEPDTSESTISIYTLKGAAIAGITFAVTLLILAVAAIVAYIYIRKRQLVPQGNTSYKSSSHNALYGVSSSVESLSNVAGLTSGASKPYMNLASRQVNAVNEADTNAYETLSLAKNADDNQQASSGNSSVPESNTPADIHSVPSTPVHEDDSHNTSGERISDMKATDDIGKDSINVVSIEDREMSEQDGAYTSIDEDNVETNKADNSKIVSAQNSTYNNYLNADLPRDLREGDTEEGLGENIQNNDNKNQTCEGNENMEVA